MSTYRTYPARRRPSQFRTRVPRGAGNLHQDLPARVRLDCCTRSAPETSTVDAVSAALAALPSLRTSKQCERAGAAAVLMLTVVPNVR